ncbi:uncharacterized protein LOC113312272 [Papaver somniferum]|uniref:uncharacterized protein LOC113312272 n=1 Tax=Papaver somniferum TaxID=3469 RepID=UPI000E6FEC68|nr:uncharacterized protein LOC113312272 [Papaver somniferum]
MDNLISGNSATSTDIQRVCDLINPNTGSWDLEILQQNFSPDIVEHITSIFINLDEEDILTWSCTPSDREGINPQQQQWIPPDDNYVKINTDAALIRNKGTTGAVAQDHRGVFLGRETITFDATSSIMDEAIVCRLGITLAKILSVDNVIFEGDAKNVTTAILGDSRDIPWNICSVIPEIKHEASSFDDAKF